MKLLCLLFGHKYDFDYDLTSVRINGETWTCDVTHALCGRCGDRKEITLKLPKGYGYCQVETE